MLVEQLGENDRVAIVVYAGAAGLVLDSTSGIAQARDPLGDRPAPGRRLDQRRGGDQARLRRRPIKNFIKGGVNRVILCTDGDFNVGVTDDERA